MKGHEQIAPLLAGYFELAAAERRAVDEHAALCAACAADLAVYRRLCAEIEGLRPVTPGGQGLARLRTTLTEPAPATRQRGTAGLTRLAWVPLLLVVLGLIGAWVAGPGRSVLARLLPPEAGRPAATFQSPLPAPTRIPTAQPAAAAPATAVAWLRQNAIPLQYVEPGNGSADLAALKPLIGSARVVVFNDTTHNGTHEIQSLRQRMLEYLVQELGFNMLVLEGDWLAIEPLDRYIQNEPGYTEIAPANDPALGQYGPSIYTSEMFYTLRWLRAYNAQAAPDRRVSLRGLLFSGRTDQALDLVTDYLGQVDPPAVQQVRKDYSAAPALLAAHRPEYPADPSAADYARALRGAQWLAQYGQMPIPEDPAQANQNYNQATWDLVDRAITDSRRTVIWTRAYGDTPDPGIGMLAYHLRGQYDKDAVSFDFAFYQGSLLALRPAMPGEATQTYLHQAAPALAGTYEDFLHQAGLPLFAIDLRGPQQTDAAAWRSAPHYTRRLMGFFDGCFPEDYYWRQEPNQRDAIIYVDRVTPAGSFAAAAPERASECLAAPQNLDFAAGMAGWFKVGDISKYDVTLAEPGSPAAGRTVHVHNTQAAGPRDYAGAGQEVRGEAYRDRRVRLTVSSTGELTGRPYLWLRSDGPYQQVTGIIRRQIRPGAPTEIVMDIPADTVHVALGALLVGEGQVTFTDFTFETVGAGTPLTPDESPDGS